MRCGAMRLRPLFTFRERTKVGVEPDAVGCLRPCTHTLVQVPISSDAPRCKARSQVHRIEGAPWCQCLF